MPNCHAAGRSVRALLPLATVAHSASTQARNAIGSRAMRGITAPSARHPTGRHSSRLTVSHSRQADRLQRALQSGALGDRNALRLDPVGTVAACAGTPGAPDLRAKACAHDLKQVKGQCADQVRRDYRVALRERIGSPGLVLFASPQGRALGLSQGDVRADFREIEPYQRPQQDSNLRTRLRRPLLYPLSYGGWRCLARA